MNAVQLTGRLARKPEVRYSESGKVISNFSIAVTRKYKNAMGEYECDFINCLAFGKTAETISEYLDKGDMIGVSGRIQTRNYEDKEGNKRYVTEVIVDSIEFLSPKKKSEGKKEEPTEDPFATFGDEVSIDDNFLD